MYLVELASRMRPAGDFDDRSRFIEILETGVSIGLECALVELQMLPRVLALAVGRVGEPNGGRGQVSGWPVVANISPEPADLGSSVAWCKHRHWRVVGVKLACRHHMIAHCNHEWSEQLAGCADPSGQRRAVEVDAFASINLRLPVERKVVCILRYQHMRQQPWSGKPAIDGPRWRGRLHDPVAGIAAQLRANMADDLEAGTHPLQHLGDVFAELPQPATAVRAGVMVGQVGVDFARKVFGQRAAKRPGGHGTFCRSDGPRLFDDAGGLQLFQLQLQLFDLAEDLLALLSEQHPLQLLDQQRQSLDLAGARNQRRRVLPMLLDQQRLDSFRIERVEVRKRGGEHERSMT